MKKHKRQINGIAEQLNTNLKRIGIRGVKTRKCKIVGLITELNINKALAKERT